MRTRRVEQITVFDSTRSHTWLACMLTSKGSTSSNIDIEYHLQVATRAFDPNKTVLCDKHMSICRRFCYFHTLVMPAACFGAGPRAIHGVSKIDVHRRKLVRNIVGPRPQTNWDSRWHIILHVLTEKIKIMLFNNPVFLRGQHRVCNNIGIFTVHCKFTSNRWVTKVLHWIPMGHATVGRPRSAW